MTKLHIEIDGILVITENEMLQLLNDNPDTSQKSKMIDDELRSMINRKKSRYTQNQLNWVLSKILYIVNNNPLYKQYKGMITDVDLVIEEKRRDLYSTTNKTKKRKSVTTKNKKEKKMSQEMIEVKPKKKRHLRLFSVLIEDTNETYRVSKHKLWRFMKNLDTLKYRYKILFNSEDCESEVLVSENFWREVTEKTWLLQPLDFLIKEFGGVNVFFQLLNENQNQNQD